ncbi:MULTISPECIES: TetR/AcrR family transcriptional regulator [Hungatella]|uniref:TetR family transcriptional regulator n=1 Tax=Hungatella hathewayi TaxID=154046 RepID=A0AAW9WCK9_9FIRM|nr:MULTISPECIES: TetR/AcrR family transcriptional regulator [Hungatella]MCQ4827430.1 TetR/AcrR family transcriptional regulator [Hungatella sp. SL.1.14]MUB61542.1 TetR family transcriptional regulator [Hungatella hathewayi]CUP00188.1 Transcriptional regulator [Hungatella hathewayi]
MKREEKNQQTRRRILESALAEFAEQGYGASSVNTISNGDGLSKGIIYHYFPTKDDLYLACVEECFQTLTGHLQSHTNMEGQTAEERLEQYFRVRLDFFEQNPQYQRIFCDAVIMPPAHLEASIQEKKAPFDRFNIDSLNRMLEPVSLRSDLSREDVVDTFRQYQDYINARYQMTGSAKIDIRDHEESCRRALHILLYGVVERKE